MKKAVPIKAVLVRVRGRVQRVGYRRYLLDLAQDQGITGHVKNEPDGSVAVLAQGERRAVGAFLRKLKNPPPPTSVKGVEEKPARPNKKVGTFRILSSGLAEEMQEGFGAMQAEFSDYRGEFKGFKSEFRDYRNEFRDYRNEFKDYRTEFKTFATRTDNNFAALNEKYGEISEKLSGIMAQLTEQAKKSQEMLEAMRNEARQTAETLNESLRLLKEAVERLPKAP